LVALSEVEAPALLCTITHASGNSHRDCDPKFADPASSLYWNFLKNQKPANSEQMRKECPKREFQLVWRGPALSEVEWALAREGLYQGTSSDVPNSTRKLTP